MANLGVPDSLPSQLRPVRGLVFDVIGTCTNWHSAVSSCIRAHQPSCIASASGGPSLDPDWADRFAHLWRSEFFQHIANLASQNEMASAVTVYTETLRKVMAMAEVSIPEGDGGWNRDVMQDLVRSWEAADVWEDTRAGLQLLRSKFPVMALTNGWTNTSIKINRRTGMQWDAVLTSELIGAYKPSPKMYETAIKALQAEGNPGEMAMVAAHVYDLEAARRHGMRTIYIRRATEDMSIDDEKLHSYGFDLIVNEGGLVELARRLGCEV